MDAKYSKNVIFFIDLIIKNDDFVNIDNINKSNGPPRMITFIYNIFQT